MIGSGVIPGGGGDHLGTGGPSGGHSAPYWFPTPDPGVPPTVRRCTDGGPRVGAYVSVRGWVDCVDGQDSAVKEVVERQSENSYSRGWSAVTGPNGDTCVFYCGTIRESAVGWFLDQLREIARLPPPIDVEDRVRGLFLAHHDVSGMHEWQVRDGQLFIEHDQDQGRYDYLFA
jgi:hypothetical protein